MYEGVKWNNRIGPAMLRRAGLNEYIVNNDKDFIEASVKLINDAHYWTETVNKMFSLNLDKLFFEWHEAHYYRAAFTYLMNNHDKIQSNGPPPFIRLKIDLPNQ